MIVCIQTLTLEKQIIKHFKNKLMAAIYVIKINVLRTELYWCDFSKSIYPCHFDFLSFISFFVVCRVSYSNELLPK